MSRMLAHIQRNPFRGAWRATAVVTLVVTAISGLLMRITDPDRFPSIWDGLWWSAQTVSTVGYGDRLPESAPGRLLAVAVMMAGVTFLSVTSAAIASAFVDAAARRRSAQGADAGIAGLAAEIRALSDEVRGLREQIDRAGTMGEQPPRYDVE